LPKSRLDILSSFLRKRYKLVLVAWLIALVVFGSQINTFFGAVNYNIAGSSFGGPTNSEAQQAQNILDAQFPTANSSSGGNGIILVIQNDRMYSSSVQSALINLNGSLSSDPHLSGSFTGMDSLYSTEYSSLAQLVPTLLPQVAEANASIAEAAESAHEPVTANYTWSLASSTVANGTAAALASSPLFTVRASSLAALLSSFSSGYSASQISTELKTVVVGDDYLQYPLALSRSITDNFVGPDNGTMLVVYNFDVSPTDSMIAAFRNDVTGSNVPSLGTYYVTGGAVLTTDVSNIFGPVVGITVVPGVVASLAIVGILLLAPLAAIIPVLVAGVAIGVALPVIYYGLVDIGHGTLTFLTPALTILLVLGLTVDYSVLQLRRTREERVKGSNIEESVATSVRWAGQAVLTAGVTVVVAYIVMAVANVPLFSSVGAAIAIAVSILIAAALTLLPSLELLLKDRLFWPGLKRQQNVREQKRSRARRLAEKTLKRRVVVVIVIAGLASCAFYLAVLTPSGGDVLKLLPNFQSNKGLTVLTQNLGSGAIEPTVIVITAATPILQSDGEYNQTLMGQIESISSTTASVSGVVSVAGPTRPYGAPFDYGAVGQLAQPERSQYLDGMDSFIGMNNETARITVGLASDAQSQTAINTLLKVESAIAKEHPADGLSVYYAGTTQSTYDDQSFLTGILPEVIGVLALAIYVILLIQLRSVFTPIRLVFTILCSVAFSLALLSALFYYGLGLPILDFAPLFVVVTMLGVGVDYDIFFVTRIREEALKGRSDNDAIKTAIDKTWVTVLGLGIVLATVFSSLVVTGIALLQEIGFVVAGALMVDVGVVIPFFVTALMGIAERFNWWPSSLAKRKTIPEDPLPEG
jgi:putative drug exporter of the RND superfamily